MESGVVNKSRSTARQNATPESADVSVAGESVGHVDPHYDICSTEHDNELVEVKASSIGLGVFAIEEFDAGEMVGYLDGQIIEDVNYESECCVYLEDDLSLEPIAPFRFLNHCCQPNCRLLYDPAEEGRASTIWIETTDPVVPGTELTIDYNWAADVAVPCQCGSPECRGWIVAEDQLESVFDRQAALEAEDDGNGFCAEPIDDLE